MLFIEAKDKFLIYLEAKGNSQRTNATYDQRLRLFWDGLGPGIERLDQVTPEMVDAWIVSMRRAGLARDTIRSRVRDVKHFFRWSVKRGYLDRSPVEHMKLPGGRAALVVKAINKDDLKRMIEAADYARDRALLLFVASTGCRSGEAANLKIKDVDLVKREAKVSGKTGDRMVDFNQTTATALADWLQQHPAPDGDFVFVGLKAPHAAVSANTIYQIYRRLAKEAGIDGRFNPHSVRHLVGQMWTDQANLELTRQKLGHQSINTTMAYANQDRSRLKRFTDKIDVFD